MGSIVTVPFHGDTLIAASEPDGVFVAMKPIAAALAVSWSSQSRRLQRDMVLGAARRVLTIPTNGGPQRMVCLRLELLDAWLFGIEDSRIEGEGAREAVSALKQKALMALTGNMEAA